MCATEQVGHGRSGRCRCVFVHGAEGGPRGHRLVVDGADGDQHRVAVGLGAAKTGIALVRGQNRQRVGAVEVGARCIGQAVQGSVDLRSGAGNGHTGRAVVGDGGAATADGCQRAVQNTHRHAQVVGAAGISRVESVTDADHVAIGRVEGQRRVFVDALSRRLGVDRRIVGRHDRHRNGGTGRFVGEQTAIAHAARNLGFDRSAVGVGAGIATVVDAHHDAVGADVVGVAGVIQAGQRGVDIAQCVGDGQGVGVPTANRGAARSRHLQGAVACRDGHRERTQILVDAEVAVHAVGVSHADARDGRGFILQRSARCTYRQGRCVVDRRDFNAESCRGLIAATAVGQRHGKTVVRAIQSVIGVTDLAVDHILHGKGAAYTEHGVGRVIHLEQQFAVADLAGHTELQFRIRIVGVGTEQISRRENARLALVNSLGTGQTGIDRDHRVVVHRDDLERHAATDGCGVGRARAVVDGEDQTVDCVLIAVIDVVELAGHQVQLADNGARTNHGIGGRVAGNVSARLVGIAHLTMRRQRADGVAQNIGRGIAV